MYIYTVNTGDLLIYFHVHSTFFIGLHTCTWYKNVAHGNYSVCDVIHLHVHLSVYTCTNDIYIMKYVGM